ncbi:MAG: hypothetical protein ACYTFG_08550 [Planctomycetota bacterium]|jgi:hypothetical protein
MPPGDKPESPALYVRPVVEEFKAFVQHKIEVLEKFKNVEQLKVFLDAMELGIRTIQEIQAEARDPEELTEVEFHGIEESIASAPSLANEPGVDTEELETDGGSGEDDGEWSLAKAGEVLVGEEEGGEDPERVGTEEDEGGEDGDDGNDTNETKEEGEGEGGKKGVLTCKWDAISEKEEDEGEEEGEAEVEEEEKVGEEEERGEGKAEEEETEEASEQDTEGS